MKNLCVPVVLLLSVGGCGDDDGGSGVDQQKELSEVTLDEAQDICDAAYGSIEDDVLHFDCTFEGILAEAQEEGDCETVRDECLEKNEDPICDVGADDLEDFDSCSTTVGEFEACLRDWGRVLEDFLPDAISCETTVEELESFEEPPIPASCAPIEEECSDFL